MSTETSQLDPAVQARQSIERQIIQCALDCLIAAGYTVRLHDGEDFATKRTDQAAEVMAEVMATDEERLYVYRDDLPNSGGLWRRVGWIFFVYGNDGHDVINDYTTNLTEVLGPVDKLADRLERGG